MLQMPDKGQKIKLQTCDWLSLVYFQCCLQNIQFMPLELQSYVVKIGSHWRCSVRKGVLRNFGKFTGKHLCQSLFFDKVAGLRPATLLKKRFWHRCFPLNFQEHLFLQNTSGGCFCFFYVSLCYFPYASLYVIYLHLYFIEKFFFCF